MFLVVLLIIGVCFFFIKNPGLVSKLDNFFNGRD